MEERLQKALASAGIGSRRNCEDLIANGRVCVNGVKATLGQKADLALDIVTVDGRRINQPSQQHIYIMLNKPSGYVTTVKDEGGRATVMELVDNLPERIFPVGRLDRDTEGLLLFTNDGDFAYTLTHPKHLVEKEYLAQVKRLPTIDDLKALRQGVNLDDGLTSPAQASLTNEGDVRLIIKEGRKRQVRRMLAYVYCPVVKLKRVRVGPLKLGDLPLGCYRHLTSDEIAKIKSLQP